MPFSYVIVANPVAGNISLDKKYKILKDVASIIGAQIYGLDTTSRQEFRECIRSLCDRYDVIIAAGGDGTFSDLINSIDLSNNIAGYIPMGTGNALRYALKYPRSVILSANKVRYGHIQKIDIIKYSNIQYAFMGSVGFEVDVIKEYKKIRKKKPNLRFPYMIAGLKALRNYGKRHLPLFTRICVNDESLMVKDAASVIVTKQPYYGYGMKVMPHAKFDDGLLHLGIFPAGIINIIFMTILSLSIGNVRGIHYTARDSVLLNPSHPCRVHIDGDLVEKTKRINFRVVPKALQIMV